ncbi:hypothetical protein [Halorussus sp. MSC15.2]|uniref:hypothetical protein n=1 Tax=Halorussus sp. MSC15.2 TaxID=2283638 RepID=UPI0013D7A6AA|nr:hypothetical protein [Halorussus sp. MSC15.2]NEU55408.1 hypothetical protein [Halorussus sp. MSC15.2]
MPSHNASKSELAGGLLVLGVAAAVGLASLTGLHDVPSDLLPMVSTWAVVGGYHVLKATSTRFRRRWFDPRVRSVLALVAFATAGYLSATGGRALAVFPAIFGVFFAVGAAVESHKRGSLPANPFFRLLVGATGLGFVALAWHLVRNYPYVGVTVMAATSAVTGLALLAWTVLVTKRD